MRIAIDYTSAVHQTEGIGRYTRNLVQTLAALDHENEYVLLHPRGTVAKAQAMAPEQANFALRSLPLSERGMTVLWHRLGVPLPADFLVGPITLFHAPDFVLPPRRAPGVVTVHDLSFLLYPEHADRGLVSYLERAVAASVRQADLILADSQNTKNDLVCLLDADPRRVAVLYLGVEEQFRPLANPADQERARRRFNLQGPIILTVGTVQPRKNLTMLLEAFAQAIHNDRLPHQLVVAGRVGWLADPIFARVTELHLDDRVRFMGFVDESDLPLLYALADLFVFPSLYEGFGLPPLEAMACGVPVVCSTAASLPEVVGDAAILVAPGSVDGWSQAMAQVVSDEALRRQLSARGLERARAFTWPGMVHQLLDLYRQVAG